jgi:putative membrane protein
MKQYLSSNERQRLNELITETEKRTNTQIVLAIINRSDTYTELPWKAFALATSIAGLSVVVLSLLLNSWNTLTTILFAIGITLLAGIVFALLAVFVPPFAKLFLSAHRAEEEVHQYAESLFLEKELFATEKRKGILVLISLFERKVIVLPDKGISNLLSRDDMHEIIKPMIIMLRRNEVMKAFEGGLKQLSEILDARGKPDVYKNELSNNIIEEEGI